MPNFCLICESDEGVFLEIRDIDNQLKKLQANLSIKAAVEKYNSRKICHRCAYELDQCSLFLDKIKSFLNQNKVNFDNCCHFCGASSSKEHIFHLKKVKAIDALLQRIHEYYPNFSEKVNKTSLRVCLNCRYTLDLIIDLKKFIKSAICKNENIDNSNIQLKIDTLVLHRSTTKPLASRELEIYSADSDIDSSAMPQKRKLNKKGVSSNVNNKNNKKATVCDKCQIPVNNEDDTYKTYQKNTVLCKDCWVVEDNQENEKRPVTRSKNAEATKVCSVFLEDVLITSSVKAESPMKIEENDESKVISLTSGEDDTDSLQSRSEPKKRINSKLKNKETNRKRRPTQRDGLSTDSEKSTPKKVKFYDEAQSDSSLVSEKRVTRNSSKSKKDLNKLSETSPVSEENVITKTKSLKELSKKQPPGKARNSRKRNFDQSDNSNGESSSSDIKRKTKLRKPLSDSDTDHESEVKDVPVIVLETDSDIDVITKTKPFEPQPSTSGLSKTKGKRESRISESLEINTHTCTECGVISTNKLIGMKHELTHFKQLSLKLQKISIPEKQTEVKVDKNKKQTEHQDTHEEISEELSQETVNKKADKNIGEAAKDKSDENAEEIAKDKPDENAEETAKDESDENVEEIAQENSDKNAEETAKENSDKNTEETVKENSDKNAEETAKEKSGKKSEETTKEKSDKNAEETITEKSNEKVEKNSDGISARKSIEICEEKSDEISEEKSDKVSKEKSDAISEEKSTEDTEEKDCHSEIVSSAESSVETVVYQDKDSNTEIERPLLNNTGEKDKNEKVCHAENKLMVEIEKAKHLETAEESDVSTLGSTKEKDKLSDEVTIICSEDEQQNQIEINLVTESDNDLEIIESSHSDLDNTSIKIECSDNSTKVTKNKENSMDKGLKTKKSESEQVVICESEENQKAKKAELINGSLKEGGTEKVTPGEETEAKTSSEKEVEEIEVININEKEEKVEEEVHLTERNESHDVAEEVLKEVFDMVVENVNGRCQENLLENEDSSSRKSP
ncbi:protein starmaker-like isoform X2 [Prorops nasuta]|uniref:protein starmaker-like isoform X2 n=1 Tax=Prorops nasuta TaxID=863751 RepID=UPI0034CF67D0